MSYDFPASPAPDQEYTPPVGGQTYIYKPPRWLVKGIPPTGGGSGGGIDEAPVDGNQYAREDAAWSEVTIPSTDWADIPNKPATFPPTVPIPWTDVSGKPTTYPPTVPIAWTDVSGKPATYPPTVPISWANISGQPATYPPTVPIAQSDITNLTTDLAGKVAKTGDTMTGDLMITSTDEVDGAKLTLKALASAAASAIIMDSGDPYISFYGRTNGNLGSLGWFSDDDKSRWGFWVGNQASGSHMYLGRYNDAGAWAGYVYDINRATGIVNFVVSPTAPTPTAGDSTTKLATTAFVGAAITADITPWSEITGKPATFPPTLPIAQADVTGLVAGQAAQDTAISSKEPTITAGTVSQWWRGDKSWQSLPATTWGSITGVPSTFPPSAHNHPQSEVTNLVSDLALKAPLASPALTGVPTAPTAAFADNSTTIATTAYVRSIAGSIVGGATIADAAPAHAQGALWWNSATGNLYISYNDGSSTQWVQINTVGT